MPPPPDTFTQILTEAVAEFVDRGYDSESRLGLWLERLRNAAQRGLMSDAEMERRIREALGQVYRRLVDREGLLRAHRGIERFTLARVKPALRAELDRRILASASLIKLDRQRAIEETLQHFSGWATSIPPGGTTMAMKREAKARARKSLASLPYVERRVAIDQGAKLAANLSEILATDGGALAGIWRSRYPSVAQAKAQGYQARPEHVERNGRVYLVRDSWAQRRGFVKPGPAGYTDEIERPAELVYCSCRYQWVHALRFLPPDMLTETGRGELARVKAQTERMRAA
ncbi:MAG TPA: hypothetical protein VGR91_16470 [Stellaceae bacterium]|nr:hypothetical protein [Stellaceae bacterium]